MDEAPKKGTVSKEPVQDPPENRRDYLDFQIEKTYSTFIAAGEQLGISFVRASLFLALTAALSLGDLETKDSITVPLLGLSLSRWHAAGVSLILTSAFFYSTALMKSAERLRDLKLKDLISRRYSVEGYHWSLFFPSVFTSTEDIGYLTILGKVTDFSVSVVQVAVIVLVPYFGFAIGRQLDWSPSAVGMTASAVGIWCLALIVTFSTPPVSATRGEILGRIEK